MHALSLHKFWKTVAMSATGVAGDSPLFLLDYLLRFIRVALLLSLWRIILGGSDQNAGVSLAAVLTYTLIAQAFANQLNAGAGIDDALWNGSIAMRFVRPMNVVAQFLAGMLGDWLLGLVLFSLPLLCLAPLFGVDPRPAGPLAGALFVPSLALAVSVGMALDFCFAALMVAFEWSVWEVKRLRTAVGTLLSGAILPLALYPWHLGEVFSWLPFASMASAPLRIYTGTGDPGPLLLIQAGWSLLLWPAAMWLWRANRERLVVYGG